MLSAGRIIATSFVPNSEPCGGGGVSFFTLLDGMTGGRLAKDEFGVGTRSVGGVDVAMNSRMYKGFLSVSSGVATGGGSGGGSGDDGLLLHLTGVKDNDGNAAKDSTISGEGRGKRYWQEY